VASAFPLGRHYRTVLGWQYCGGMPMKFLANIGQEKYFQFSGVNGVFAGLWVGKAIFLATPIHLATRNQGKNIENGFHACGTTFWRPLSHNSD